MVEFIIPGDPRGKARPRVVRTRDGRSMAFTPDKTIAYEELIRQRFRQQWEREDLPFPDKTPVCVKITAGFGIPKSTSKKARLAMLAGQIGPTKKPDMDNIAKIVLDALNGFAWHDDVQVLDLHISKFYTDHEPFVCVSLTPYKPI